MSAFKPKYYDIDNIGCRKLEAKEIAIPLFQRPGVWKAELVKRFLDAIFKHRPVGVLYLAKVGEGNSFAYFPFEIDGAEEPDQNSCQQYILDGQQRLRALWSGFKDVHSTHSYFAVIDGAGNYKEIYSVAKSKSSEGTQIRDPNKDRRNKRIPLYLLDPTSDGPDETWFQGIQGANNLRKWRSNVRKLRNKVSAYPLPYFEVDCAHSSREEIIDIFLNINRSAVSLSPYNLALSEMEKKTGKSLYNLITGINSNIPQAGRLEGYKDTSNQDNLIQGIDGPPMGLGELILKIECLRQGADEWYDEDNHTSTPEITKPTNNKMIDLKFGKLNESVGKIKSGLQLTANILEEKFKIKGNFMLPTTVPLRVLPALFSYIPKKRDDAYRSAEKLLVDYLAFSFFTDRYQQRANDALTKDFEKLLLAMVNISNPRKFKEIRKEIPIFLEGKPFDINQIKRATWPQRVGIVGRSILLLRYLDFSSPAQSSCDDIVLEIDLAEYESERHFHHIFPKGKLYNIGIDRAQRDVALNCMLLDPHSNQEWLDQWPGDFVKGRIEQEVNRDLEDEGQIRDRLETRLNKYTLSTPSNGIANLLLNAKEEVGEEKLIESYDAFIDKSAEAFREKMVGILKSILQVT